MAKTLEYVNREFRKLKSNVYISNDIICNETDGSAKITKWISDYEKACPMGITTSFTPLTGGNKAWHPLYISRYMPFNRLLEDLKDNKITFLSPRLWTDPFESLLYRDDLKFDGKHYDIRCICATYDSVYNEEAAWNRADKMDEIVRVDYDFNAYCEMLSAIADESQCSFYLSIADYSQSKDKMTSKNIAKAYSTLGEYIQVMSLKRKAFAYENELRIFAVFEEPETPLPDVASFNLQRKLCDVIVKVTLPPLKPIKSICDAFDYDELQGAKNLPMRDKLSKFLDDNDKKGTKRIQESRLYSKK